MFTIDAVEAYDTRTFPDDEVYGTSARAELRLITCGAGFDKRHDRYLESRGVRTPDMGAGGAVPPWEVRAAVTPCGSFLRQARFREKRLSLGEPLLPEASWL